MSVGSTAAGLSFVPGSEGRTTVIVADRNRSFADAIAQSLSADAAFHILGVTTDAEDASQVIRLRRPQLVVVDDSLPGRGFLGLADETAVRLGETRVVLIADRLPDVLLEQALAIPVAGILLKEEPLSRMMDFLRRIAGGDTVFSDAIRTRVEYQPRKRRFEVRQRSALARLSARQIEVLQQLALGRRVKEVADSLHLSEKAVESHKYRIMNRLNIHDRVELALYAVREGLIRV